MGQSRTKLTVATLVASLLGAAAAAVAGGSGSGHGHDDGHGRGESNFVRVASLANYLNNTAEQFGQTTVSEIVAATANGLQLVYTDGPLAQVGVVDIRDPRQPLPAGKINVGGEPTSVDILGNRWALVSVNTSASFVAPSGKLVVIDLDTHQIVREMDLGGQPDSLKISPDRRYAAVVIENERDEDVADGALPQAPAGYLSIIDLKGEPAQWQRRDVALTGLAAVAPEDPEPEFVDINPRNEAAVTLQENNHVVVVDLRSGRVKSHFSAGTVDLANVDTVEDDDISPTGTLTAVPREPDAVAWVPTGHHGWALATANEGDLVGGSRGFTLFDVRGTVLFDSGNSLEHIAIRHGHYPEGRSENKGVEPEAVEFGRFGDRNLLFVGSERGSFVAVYDVDGRTPRFRQLLPAPLGPEGVLAIPSRNLLVVAGEEDDAPLGVRSSLSIYALRKGPAAYPQIVSGNDAQGAPLAWSALSGMVALPGQRPHMLAVWDSYYAPSRIFTIDAGHYPARVEKAQTLTGNSKALDPEGIAIAPDGTRWIASEGNASDSRQNLLVQVDAAGQVLREAGLPANILACRKASTKRGTLGSGFEGVMVQSTGNGPSDYRLWVAQQRGWNYTTPECEDLDDDAGGLNALGEPNHTRLWVFEPGSSTWTSVAWELAPKPIDAAWVGLSEITRAPDGSVIVLERDNRTGNFAELKTLVRFGMEATTDGLVTLAERQVANIQPAMERSNGLITDKPEGVSVQADGRVFVVTDNDGVDDWNGESSFLRLGDFRRLFR